MKYNGVLDLAALTEALAREPGVELAVLFGSAKDGTIPPEGDVDVGVLLHAARWTDRE